MGNCMERGRLNRFGLFDVELESLMTAAETLSESVCVTDLMGTIHYVNPSFERLTGFSAEVAVGCPASISSSGIAEPEFFQQLWQNLNKGVEFQCDFINRKRDGSLYIERKLLKPLKDEAGVITHFLSRGRDVGGGQIHLERLAYLATHDQLTGLPNRFIFIERIRLEMALAQKTLRGFAICFIDVDGLKKINDSFGHGVGDQLIQRLAKDLYCPLRDIDALARLGGDEFGLLLTDISSHADVEKILMRLLKGPSKRGRDALQFEGLSIGVCLYPAIDEDAATLIHLADQAMYQVKTMGGRGYCFSAGVGEDLGTVSRVQPLHTKRSLQLSHRPTKYTTTTSRRAPIGVSA